MHVISIEVNGLLCIKRLKIFCSGEVKLKVTVKGVQRIDRDEIEQTRDDFKSTKDDFKSTCFTFVKLVMKNRIEHFHQLKEHFDFNGISLQSLNQVGFNIIIYFLCSSLGAFEILHHNYKTGRLKNIIHSTLVSRDHLVKLNARQLELSVDMEEGMDHKYRDILIVRGPAEENVLHPVDVMEYFECDDDEDFSTGNDHNLGKLPLYFTPGCRYQYINIYHDNILVII